jgi:D-lactate dehydrogenase
MEATAATSVSTPRHGSGESMRSGLPRAPRREVAQGSVSERLALSHDASHFRIMPADAVIARHTEQVARMVAAARGNGDPITFRSGGTSLSGQAQAAGLLVDTRRHFRSVEVLDDGARVRVQPGATVRQVNARLAPYGFRLGPDPASESAATVGGVIANNSSGMLCGTEFNTYRTLESLVVVLPSGTVVDTGSGDADYRLRVAEPALYEGLLRLRDRVRGNPVSVRLIERLFGMKNTMGYAVNAFVDFTYPVDILTHLMVGSEGTLGFIAEATFRTVPVRPQVATGFLVFDSIERATGVLPELVGSGLAAIEVLDATALRVTQQDPVGGRALPGLTVDRHAGLLVEFQEFTEQELADRVERARGLLDRLPVVLPAELTQVPGTRADLWHVRKGLYAAVAGARPSGTTALLEDVAVPVPALAGTCQALTGLFDRHGYEESVIFGHAKDGNIHFLLNERFDRTESLARFTAFTEDMVELVLGAGGTLKAEHGTGRMMAPFVRRQYGDELYEVMREIKALFDPAGILNPGVIISDDPTIHLQHLKTTPTVETEVDRCVDCGFCEPVCPSRDLTLTPRQRIALRRERARAEQAGDTETVRQIDATAEYALVDTCAADGMCATACPVGIDTGALVKRLRADAVPATQQRAWTAAARHWARTTTTAARALTIAQRVPRMAAAGSRAARRVAGDDAVPLWDAGLPAGGVRREPRRAVHPVAVFMPACVGSMFGPEPGYPGVTAALLALCEAARVEVVIPDGIADTCCGTPFASKGMTTAHGQMRDRMESWLWRATDHGRLPVVVDAASCTEGLTGLLDRVEATYGRSITVVDALTFTVDTVLPRLPKPPTRLPSLVVHPTCSTTRLGLTPTLLALAGTITERVEVPADWGCCGFAGDRGLLHPELTASATATQAAQVCDLAATAQASANRTCEIGMTRATGRPYAHVLEHLAITHALVPAPLSTEPDHAIDKEMP